MNRLFYLFVVLSLTSCGANETNPFLQSDEPVFERQVLFDGERFPNITVTTKGTVIAVWGGISEHYGTGSLQVRRSSNGGETWADTQVIKDPVHWYGGGVVVD